MADSQVQKKNKKSRKKSETNIASAVAPINDDINSIVTLTKDNSNQNLSKDVNIKTLGSTDDTVNPDTKPEIGESANKKKKKSKKKSKEVLKETFPENKPEPLLNFSENGIQLVNHPEISVTITDSSQSKDEAKCITDKIPPFDEKKQTDNTVVAPAKKKKKKKKSGNNVPVETVTSNEPPFATPTYTKVVTADNTCVLFVNNEKFSMDTTTLENSEGRKNNMSENSIDFSIPSEKQLGDVLLTKNFTPDTNITFSNSVSIFPVLTNENSDVKPQTGVNLNQNLETVSTVLTTESSESIVKENLGDSKPTKSQLKAERRAKQEAQRAAKLAKSNAKPDTNPSDAVGKKNNSSKAVFKESNSKVNESEKNRIEKMPAKLPVEKESLHKMKLFSHLPQYKQFDIDAKVHPAILEVGFQYNKGTICGSNARCIALLEAFKEVINDYTLQPDKKFCRNLELNIQKSLRFLNNCRPLSASMINAIKFLKYQINRISSDMKLNQIKESLCEFINNFVKEEILLAKEAICSCASYKIVDGDVILVFGHSSLVRDVLCEAHNKNKIFRVVVVGSRPKLEGLKMSRYLEKQGIHCSYISVTSISNIMKEVSMVILGAHALLFNGSVISRIGNKEIALAATLSHVPVFVCCETYKVCEHVLTDSFVHNELGKPEDISTTSLVSNDSLKNWCDALPSLQCLNLLYDVISSDLISEIITEKGALPCSSVPVVLRVRDAVLI